MAQEATATARSAQAASIVAGLARFFQDATPVRMRVQLARLVPDSDAGLARFTESVVLEFGTPREVLFECKTALEFGENLRVRNADGSFDETVSVVAAQYYSDKTVVAARFLKEVPNWIVKS